MMVIYLCHQ